MKEQEKDRAQEVREICRAIEHIEGWYLWRIDRGLKDCKDIDTMSKLVEYMRPGYCGLESLRDFEDSQRKLYMEAIVELAETLRKNYERKKQELEARL